MKVLIKLLSTLLTPSHFLVVSIFLFSCGRATSPANPNLPPNTTLANIPVESDTLFALQTLHWDGEDDDGFIAKFQYRYTTFHLFGGDSVVQEWQETTETSLTIAFESSDELNFQIFQVRAVDNAGNIDPTPAEKRFFTVKTVFPETEILTPVNNQKLFVIEQTTDWWLGIQLSFTAKDEDGEVVEYAWIVDRGDTTWTQDTTLYVPPDRFDLPLAGNHTIRVTSRDNTNLIDPIGDSVTVALVQPSFSRNILIIDETDETNFPFGVFPSGTSAQARDDSVDNFYAEIFGTSTTWDYKSRGVPPLDTLGQYGLLIWHADDSPSSVPHALPQHLAVIMDYLNVGGDFIMSGWRILKSFAWNENFPFAFPGGNFVHDYLHINSADETPLVPSDFTHGEGFGGFSTIRVDSTKLAGFPFFGKLAQVNIVLQRGGFTQVIHGYQNELQGLTWPRGNPVGLRYFGTSFDAVIFGLPMFFIKKEDAQILASEILQSLGY